MATALKGMPDNPYTVPDGIVSTKIDPTTGTLVGIDDSGIYEYFYDESPPPEVPVTLPPMQEEDTPYTGAVLPTTILSPSPDRIVAPKPSGTAPPSATPNTMPSNNNSATKILNPSGL